MIADTVNHLDETTGRTVGIGVGFFGICIFMILLFLAMVWIGKQREKRGGPREAPKLPLLIREDEERARRRHGGH